MKNLFKRVLLVFCLISLASTTYAQKDKDKSTTKIKVKTKDGYVDFETKMEDLGEMIGESVEKMENSIHVETDFDDDSFSFDFDFDFDADAIEEWGEKFGESVENMVKNMDIEMTNLDPEDFEDNEVGDRDGRDILREIEREYDSEVELIEKMHIKIRDGKVDVDLEALLENGKVVKKTYRDVED